MPFDPAEPTVPPGYPQRVLNDAITLRALAHPLRMRILQLAAREGTLTATRAAEMTDQSPANCSFHLRTLAKYGFLEPAEGGTGRERPWKPVALSHRWLDDETDPAATAAGEALTLSVLDRHREAVAGFIAERRTFPPGWQRASINDAVLYVTEEEFAQIGRDIVDIGIRYLDRVDPAKRPDGARPVLFAGYAVPLRPTPQGN